MDAQAVHDDRRRRNEAAPKTNGPDEAILHPDQRHALSPGRLKQRRRYTRRPDRDAPARPARQRQGARRPGYNVQAALG